MTILYHNVRFVSNFIFSLLPCRSWQRLTRSLSPFSEIDELLADGQEKAFLISDSTGSMGSLSCGLKEVSGFASGQEVNI
jgi:hypothetical protein